MLREFLRDSGNSRSAGGCFLVNQTSIETRKCTTRLLSLSTRFFCMWVYWPGYAMSLELSATAFNSYLRNAVNCLVYFRNLLKQGYS